MPLLLVVIICGDRSIFIGVVVYIYIYIYIYIFGEKVRWPRHKNAPCCFKQILEAAHNKTSAVEPLTSHLTNHPDKQVWCCRRSKDEFISDVLLWTTTHGHTSVNWSASTYIHQLCASTGCSLEDLPKEMDDRDGWRERYKDKEFHAIGKTW